MSRGEASEIASIRVHDLLDKQWHMMNPKGDQRSFDLAKPVQCSVLFAFRDGSLFITPEADLRPRIRSSGGMLWIAWERHRRTTVLAAELGARLCAFQSSRTRFLRHPSFLLKTLRCLLRERPRVLIVQSPSLLLELVGVLLKHWFGYHLVVDAHNAAVLATSTFERMLAPLFVLFHRATEITIVSNPWHAEVVARRGGTPAVLPDKIPNFDVPVSWCRRSNELQIVFIRGHGRDESSSLLLAAARLLPRHYTILVTGACVSILAVAAIW